MGGAAGLEYGLVHGSWGDRITDLHGALDRVGRLQAFHHAEVTAGQGSGEHKIGIDVGAGDAWWEFRLVKEE